MTKELLEFPCDFVIKIIAANDDATQAEILQLIKIFFTAHKLQKRLSKKNGYISFTLNVFAKSKEILDDFYIKCNAINKVHMVL